MTLTQIMERIKWEGFNVTFSGGDPIYQLDALIPLAKAIHDEGLTIWLYTGYTYDSLLKLANIDQLTPYIDTIVDGPYIESLRDVGLQFRGSSNQRIIKLR